MSYVRVGDRVSTKYGEVVEVLMVESDKAITVQFLEAHKWITVCTVQDLCEGTVANPYTKTVHGVGWLGVDPYGVEWERCSADYSHRVWRGMLSRCYSKEHPDDNYSDVIVDMEWRDYSVFKKWYDYEMSNFVWWTGPVEIDKDILTPLRIYGPETSCLVPPEINVLIRRNRKRTDGVLPGVFQYGDYYKVHQGFSCSKVKFYSEEDAHMAYLDSKIRNIREKAREFRTRIKPEIYNALMSRDFRYLFSPLFKSNSS